MVNGQGESPAENNQNGTDGGLIEDQHVREDEEQRSLRQGEEQQRQHEGERRRLQEADNLEQDLSMEQQRVRELDENVQSQLIELQNEIVKMKSSNNSASSEMGRAIAITKAIVPYNPKSQTFEEWRSKFEGRARLLRLPYQELLEFLGLCLTDKPWEVYNRRLNHDPKETPDRTYYGIIAEMIKQYSETPKHAFSTLCKMRYKKDVFRHSTEIHRLTKLAFPKLPAEARNQICVQVFWKSLPQSKIVEGYYNTFMKLPKQTLTEAVTLVGDSLDANDGDGDEGSDKEDSRKDEDKVVAVGHWEYSYNGGKGKGKGFGKGKGKGFGKGNQGG